MGTERESEREAQEHGDSAWESHLEGNPQAWLAQLSPCTSETNPLWVLPNS